MSFREKPMVSLGEEEWLKKIVKGCFGYRRKTLMNALKHSGLTLSQSIESRVKKIGIDLRRRPETLAIQELVDLAEALKE
jgi:16S rRNA (adenine1518-N6/adenine1519-N6)-dimethyltransferase